MADSMGNSPYKELAKRFFITFLLGVVIYRLGIYVTVPGIDLNSIAERMNDQGGLGALLNMANMFNGGALVNGSLFGLGIMPYISASIIFQLLAVSVPSLKALQKEGEPGRRKIQQYTRYATVAICLVQSAIACAGIASAGDLLYGGTDTTQFIVFGSLIITTGSMILLWLADMITKHGVGNGVSVIIMIGIIASFPGGIASIANDPASGTFDFLTVAVVFLVIIAAMVMINQARRQINLEQQRRVQGNKVYGGNQTKLPLMLNHANVIPVIFAYPVMTVLGLLMGLIGLQSLMGPGESFYRYLFIGLIVFFTFFYISLTVNLNEWSDNFKQGGFFIKGVKPGKSTADYISYRLNRITFIGALSLAFVAVVPSMIGTAFIGLDQNASYTLLGGVGLLIVVGVGLDVMQKVSSYLLSHQYQGLMQQSTGEGGETKPTKPGKGGTKRLASNAKRF